MKKLWAPEGASQKALAQMAGTGMRWYARDWVYKGAADTLFPEAHLPGIGLSPDAALHTGRAGWVEGDQLTYLPYVADTLSLMQRLR